MRLSQTLPGGSVLLTFPVMACEKSPLTSAVSLEEGNGSHRTLLLLFQWVRLRTYTAYGCSWVAEEPVRWWDLVDKILQLYPLVRYLKRKGPDARPLES